MGINGEHTNHHRFILQYFLSLHEINLSRSTDWHLLLDNCPLDLPRVCLEWTLLGIVAFLATFETSTQLVSLSQTIGPLVHL